MTNTEATNAATRINRRTFATAFAVPGQMADGCYVQITHSSGRLPVQRQQLHTETEVEAFIQRCTERANAWAAVH